MTTASKRRLFAIPLSRIAAGAAALTATACMPAPGPSAPTQGELEIGADYRPSSIDRWVCATEGSVVLARRGEELVLHLENLDWVLRGEDAGDVVRFGHQGQTVYLVSKAKRGDLVIERASANGTTDEKCVWVET